MKSATAAVATIAVTAGTPTASFAAATSTLVSVPAAATALGVSAGLVIQEPSRSMRGLSSPCDVREVHVGAEHRQRLYTTWRSDGEHTVAIYV